LTSQPALFAGDKIWLLCVCWFIKQYPDTSNNPDLEGVVEYVYNTPLELTRYYDSKNNPNNEDLYLVILPVANINYTGITEGDYGNFVSAQYFTKLDGTKVLQSSYIAINIGDITDEDADIQYDHVDKIDYIDSIKFRFRLPNTLQ